MCSEPLFRNCFIISYNWLVGLGWFRRMFWICVCSNICRILQNDDAQSIFLCLYGLKPHINVCFWYAFTRQVFQNHARRHIWKRSRPCSARWHITRRLSCCAKMLTAWNPCWICEAVFSVCCMVLAHVSSLTSRVQRRQDLLGWSLAYWWIEWRIHYINWTPNETLL